MNTIDKIRAEIKKRRLHFNKEAEKYQALNNGYSQNCYGARDALRDLENFLDTLEPVSEDLEKKTFDDYLKANPAERRKMKMTEILGEERLAKTKEQMDLEEAADDHIRKVVDAAGHPGWDWGTQDIADAFKAGAEWMKAKMLKEEEQ